MRIRLSDAGKRFNREWIFRHATIDFSSGTAYAITGANGSGKSTLLQTIAGLLMPSEGSVSYEMNGSIIPPDKTYQHLSFCAPYLEVVEEMNLSEFLHFHQQFKPFLPGITIPQIAAAVDLPLAPGKHIQDFSSGMKQRVKLAQAIFSDTSVLLLDEPCSNLDADGIGLYHGLIRAYCSDRLVIVCSNDEVEYSFCKERLSMQSFK